MSIISFLFKIRLKAFNGCMIMQYNERAKDYSEQVKEALKLYDRKCEIEAAKESRGWDCE